MTSKANCFNAPNSEVAWMAGLDRTQETDAFGLAQLAYYDTIGQQAQGSLQQFVRCEFSFAQFALIETGPAPFVPGPFFQFQVLDCLRSRYHVARKIEKHIEYAQFFMRQIGKSVIETDAVWPSVAY